MDLFIIFSCFLRALKVVYLCFKEVRGWGRSFKTLRRFPNKWLISINMFIVSKSVEYLPYIGHPQYLTYLFIVNSIVRSLCFLENISPVKLPPKIFLWDVFTVIYFIYKDYNAIDIASIITLSLFSKPYWPPFLKSFIIRYTITHNGYQLWLNLRPL